MEDDGRVRPTNQPSTKSTNQTQSKDCGVRTGISPLPSEHHVLESMSLLTAGYGFRLTPDRCRSDKRLAHARAEPRLQSVLQLPYLDKHCPTTS